MGKKAAEGKAEAKAEAKPKAKAGDSKEAKDTDAQAPERLGRLRPKPRPVFFVIFVAICAVFVIFYNPCDVKVQRRKDCGYSGISDMECKTVACFLQGSKPFLRKTMKVKREEGTALGVSYTVDQASGNVYVDSVNDGAVKAFNAELAADSEDRILPGDAIVKVDGKTSKKILDALKVKGTRTFELEIQRSRLPFFLRWIHGQKHLKLVERVLTSPGFRQWWRSFFNLGRLGLAFWYISGYPMASVPMYVTISGAVAFNTARCCHDEQVPEGTPHCYRGLRESPEAIIKKVAGESFQLLERVKRSPRSYFDWLFNPFAN